MKVLLDECVNRRLKRHLVGHEFRTTREMGWSGLGNGDLLIVAQHDFDVLITQDRKLPHQQNLTQYDLAVIVIRARSNRIDALLPLLPKLLASIPLATRGQATIVEGDMQ